MFCFYGLFCEKHKSILLYFVIKKHNKTTIIIFGIARTCKDTMNISEFIDNIQLQLSDLENICNLGYVEWISNIIIDKHE